MIEQNPYGLIFRSSPMILSNLIQKHLCVAMIFTFPFILVVIWSGVMGDYDCRSGPLRERVAE